MAITTLQGAIDGLAPITFCQKVGAQSAGALAFSYWYSAGYPAPATANASGLAGAVCNSSTPGAIPFPTPPAGANTYLGKIGGGNYQERTIVGASFHLIDRLWHNSGLSPTLTTAQTVNSVAWPARDSNGTSNGEDVYIALELSTATGAGANVPTISYTNSDGVAGRTATLISAYGATSRTGSWFVFGLQAGDVGVRSVQTYTNSVSMTSGNVHLVAFRVIHLPTHTSCGQGGLLPASDDVLSGCMPRLFDGSCLMWTCTPTSGTSLQTWLTSGEVAYTWG